MEKPQRRIDWGEAVVPGIGLLFCLAYYIQTWNAPRSAMFWPIMVSVVAGLFWVLVVVKFLFVRRPTASESQQLTWPGFKKRYGRLLLIGLGAIGYVTAVPYIGFSISNFIFMQVIFRGLGSRRWATNVAVALGITLFLHVALIVLMKLSLPQLTLGPVTI